MLFAASLHLLLIFQSYFNVFLCPLLVCHFAVLAPAPLPLHPFSSHQLSSITSSEAVGLLADELNKTKEELGSAMETLKLLEGGAGQ